MHILTIKKEVGGEINNHVYLHYFDSPLSTRFVQWLTFSIFSAKKIRSLCRNFGIDIIHDRSPSYNGSVLIKDKKLPFVVSLHGTSFGEITSYLKIPFNYASKSLLYDATIAQPSWAFLTRLEYKSAKKILAVSKAVADEAVRYYRLPNEKLVVVHNGVHILQVKEKEEENVILSVGRMVWRKGFTYLIGAMPHILKEHPETKLILVGDGAYKRFLQDYVRKLRIQNSVLFYGNMPREKLFHLYARAQLYVQPSLYEPLGNTILEAMASEKPVIATNVGGIPEIITHGKDGLLIKPHSSLQIAQATKLLFSDASYRKNLGQNAKAKVKTHFSWESAAKKTLQIYEELLHN